MKPVHFITRTTAFFVGIGVMLLVIEGVIRLLPVIDGTYAADPRASWPVHTMIPDSQYTYSSGWNLQNVHRGRINNYGYASPHDYVPGRGDVAVFGDSYIESLMNEHVQLWLYRNWAEFMAAPDWKAMRENHSRLEGVV